MKRMVLVFGVLAACGGGGGGGNYDATMQRLMTAPTGSFDVVGEWTDTSTSQIAVVMKDDEGFVIVALVSGSPTLPPLSSLEGGRIEPEKHKVAHGVLASWAAGKEVIPGAVVLMTRGMWRESHDTSPCSKDRGFSLDQHQDKNGAPVLWVSMFDTKGGPGLPRTMYFEKAKDNAVDAATMAKIKEFGKECTEPAAAAPPTT